MGEQELDAMWSQDLHWYGGGSERKPKFLLLSAFLHSYLLLMKQEFMQVFKNKIVQ